MLPDWLVDNTSQCSVNKIIDADANTKKYKQKTPMRTLFVFDIAGTAVGCR
jgi:hypothetical protein